MLSRAIFLLAILFLISCKESGDQSAVTEQDTQEEKVAPKTKEELLLEKTYRVQLSQYGDTLLPYIPQDSVPLFFARYGNNHPETKVRLKTKYGNIDFKLYEDTPLYRASFIFLVKNDYFDLTEIYRVVPEFVVQAGNSDEPLASMKRASSGNYKLPPRYNPERKHVRGTLSLAKQYEDNDEDWHNPFDFFVTLSPSPHLDGAHTIFGEVIAGMDVADRISQLERDSTDWPNEAVFITMEVLE
ncbi:peptidylprolyl isomerase [Nonlabens spongiae]|uniref:Peptidyl-prolyl cis-trans isomerase n=1 Tax=Nonlabens spongiae TaxID=331648 RepID=A0A1W6MI12_9FLAO|nr:peptidylprolyl isomerase [Nonlabens spongiae]ARN77207.1 peptidylprolyl isomerase [Nonlabens spongiae]